MNKTFNFLVLAVTKTFEGYCVAGMNKEGRWIRPLPPSGRKFWDIELDKRQIKVGDVWEISEWQVELDATSPRHTEDIRLNQNPAFGGRMSNEQLVEFAIRHQESVQDLNETLNADSRSLCLVSVDSYNNFMDHSSYNNKQSPRMTFEIQGEEYQNTTRSNTGFPITDLKWRAYTMQNKQVENQFNDIFICIGLARMEPKKDINKEYPMLISLITNPEVPLLPTYPN